MHRGAVFIGVDQTGGGLPLLKAAASGSRQMHEWAVDPERGGFDPTLTRLLTDTDDATVTSDAVQTAVEELVAAGVDQLIVYFGGHGLLVDMVETWLLSGAPLRSSAAISVGKSIQAAKRGRTPHVVIISDACRTPAKDLDTQSLTPVAAFPNVSGNGMRPRVDVFYASAQGQAALEITSAAARKAEGIYTGVLHDALNGTFHDANGLERDVMVRGDHGDPRWYIYTNPLCVYLEAAVATRLAEHGIDMDQSPTFDVQVGPNPRWLARLTHKPVGPRVRSAGSNSDAVQHRSMSQIVGALYQTAAGPWEVFESQLLLAEAEGAGQFVASVRALLAPLSSLSQYGNGVRQALHVRGARIRRARIPQGPLVTDGHTVALPMNIGGTHMVTLDFDNDTVTQLPVLDGHVTEVHVVDRHIGAVLFDAGQPEPARATPLRRITAIVTACAQRRRMPDVHDGVRLAALLSRSRLPDPALGLYQAYALHSRQEDRQLEHLRAGLSEQLGGIEFADLTLLDQNRGADSTRTTAYPLLTQGWDLLSETLQDHAGLELRRHLLPSLWTVFDRSAADLLFPHDRNRQ